MNAITPPAIDATDVCVIGGGLAGLSAGLRAAELGRRTVVLEKGTENLYPCNSRYAGGVMHLAFLDIGQRPDALVRALREKCPSDLDIDLVAAIGAASRITIDWLVSRANARFIHAGPEPWQKYVLAPPRPMRSGLVWPGRGPDVLLRGLDRAFANAGGSIVRGALVRDVVRNGPDDLTVEFERDGMTHRLAVRAVIVADGGFGASVPLLSEFISGQPEALLHRHAGTANGFGIELARRLGADLTGLNRFYGHLQSVDALRDKRLWPYPTLDDLAAAGIVINGDGQRFLDEGLGGVSAANEVARHAPGAAFVIIDERIWRDVGPRTRIVPCNPFLLTLGATMHKGMTIEAAANAAGLNPAVVAGTVGAYNASTASDLTPRRSPGKFGRAPLTEPPFYIVPLCAAITYTMGGLRVDTHTRVLSADGQPLPGLFAAGSTVGGTEGGARAFYLGGLAKSAILGRIAGENAASYAGTARDQCAA